VLYLLDINRFILDPVNHAKVSQRDFAYQLWLPLFKKLLYINNSLVRIKVGETVLSGFTSSKADLYSNHDIRILFNFKQDVFGIVCGEECILLAGQDKIEHNKSKLLREGELMQITLLSGPNSSFYASQITKKIK
ncbi:uncharacterized protein EV154DRAFT_578680, partial [Mucor mucedo]|uniref:uncharacterized protein n=1 Tax=Mucor mucedo TaxID=29922 RepID=UPI00221E3B8B